MKLDYSLNKMFNDLGCDFLRYCHENGLKTKNGILKKIQIIIVSPSLLPISNHRFGYWINSNFKKKLNPIKIIFKIIYFIMKYISVCLIKIDIDVASNIGPGLVLSNKGNIMLGAIRIGANCTINDHVTLGMDNNRGMPSLGDNVWIGSNSIIYGGIVVGNNVVIMASSVLSRNITSNVLIGGNPCKLLKKEIKNGPYNLNLMVQRDV